MTRTEVADLIGVPRRTLDQWAYLNRGPSYFLLVGHARYRRSEVEAWVRSNRRGGDLPPQEDRGGSQGPAPDPGSSEGANGAQDRTPQEMPGV